MTTPESVIEIGSTGIRLLIAEFSQDKKLNILDRSEMPIALGRDVFTNNEITQETQNQCIQILRRYVEQLAGWALFSDLSPFIPPIQILTMLDDT